jgi:hypothetical protein
MIHAPNNPRTHRVTVLLRADELRLADKLAREQGISRSDLLRSPLYAPRPAPTVERGETSGPSVRRGE